MKAQASFCFPSEELDPPSILRDLDTGIDELPELAIRACQAHRETMTPYLWNLPEA